MNKVLSFVFTAVFIVILYGIIILALRIMAKDVKNGGKKKKLKKAGLGFEVLSAGDNTTLKTGSVIPINGVISLGRKESNSIILDDQYVSGNHAEIYEKNGQYILEDLDSTNGTFINNEGIRGKRYIEIGDVVKIGSLVLKIIG